MPPRDGLCTFDEFERRREAQRRRALDLAAELAAVGPSAVMRGALRRLAAAVQPPVARDILADLERAPRFDRSAS